MRKRVELSLKVGPGTSSRLELSAESDDPGGVVFTVEDLSRSSEAASSVDVYGVAVTVNSSGDSTPSKMASIKLSYSGRATAGSGA